jgi:hypothetical protein
MLHLEPSYLRYIYDGLEKGDLHPDNAAALPEGLIGLYDEAFDESKPARERQKLLNTFGLWSLLKKEVSAQFVAEILDVPTQEIIDFIATYSNWFKSPESSKYQLYHERLKVYLLQKLSEGEVIVLNKRIIHFLSIQFGVLQKSESVFYCYQYLPYHAFVDAKINLDCNLLSELCLSESFKKRQFDLSGFYDWEEQLMQLGVECFALKDNKICDEIVFEKTKIQYKKKDIDLILSLIRIGEMEIVFRFFQNNWETDHYARIELAYFYFLAFFEIFEKEEFNFIKKKETAGKLLEIFENNFQWENAAFLSSYVDVNISFRLHCYFKQFGLDFKVIAVLSSDHKVDYFDFVSDIPLKFIDSRHFDEAKLILKDFKKYDYGLKDANSQGLIVSNIKDRHNENIGEELNDKIKSLSKTQLIKAELAYSIEIIKSFDELCTFIKKTLRKIDITREIKLNILSEYKNLINVNSFGLFSIKGNIGTQGGKNKLEFTKNDCEKIIQDNSLLPELIANGLAIDEFMKMDINKRYQLLLDEKLDIEDNFELMLFFIDIGEYYQKEKPNDLQNLLSKLLIDFHLNINEKFKDKFIDDLIDLMNSSIEDRLKFECTFFIQLLEFFNQNDTNGQRKEILEKIKDTLLETYFDFSYYHYSFISGCKLINLFTKYKIDFPENEIVERIIEDLNYLIEEKDYTEILEIENCNIINIYQKSYFWDFYNTVKRIYIEELNNNLSRYIFEDIIEKKGVSYNTILFFKDNSNQFPGMYSWAIKLLSIKNSETNPMHSYIPIRNQNDLLLERLLLNIVSNRNKFKVALNIEILKYYGLDWLLVLDKEYEILSAKN